MNGCFEQYFLNRCACRITRRFPAHSAVACTLSEWLEQADLGLDWGPDFAGKNQHGLTRESWAALGDVFEQASRQASARMPDQLNGNIQLLAKHVGLDDASIEIFILAVRTSNEGPLHDLCRCLLRDGRLSPRALIACLTQLSEREVSRTLGQGGALIAAGLIKIESAAEHGKPAVVVPARLLGVLELATGGLDDILDRLFDVPGAPAVAWEDFRHLGEPATFVARLLRGAMKGRSCGINILFYGPPGTGKTEFCKVLADHLGARLHAVGESDEGGNSPSRHARICDLHLGQNLLAGRHDTLLLFEEMEDLLTEREPAPNFTLAALSTASSKVHTNRIFETNRVPTLWTCNDLDGFDPALLRRFTLAIEMRCPTQKVRERVWKRLAEKQGVDLDDAACARLAREMPEPPALAANALRAAALGGGGVDDVAMAVSAVSKVMRKGRARAPINPAEAAPFALDLANANTDITRLMDRLGAKGASRAVSLCLSGPPGSGKSAFARALAQKMDLPVIQKRASDILSMWVGGSEQNIAAAFAEARVSGAFLIFDEADSLLSSREMAMRTYEVSQVNEMLTWMESHPLPFACTTNLAARLDIAALRRFTFKVRFRPLEPRHLSAAFALFFEAPVPLGLTRLTNLTPGDFANVKRRSQVLGLTSSAEILRELEAEQAAKPDTVREIGFRPVVRDVTNGRGSKNGESTCDITGWTT